METNILKRICTAVLKKNSQIKLQEKYFVRASHPHYIPFTEPFK